MNIEDIKPSSYYEKKKLEEKAEPQVPQTVEKIVKGQVQIHKAGIGERMLKLFVPEDIEATKDYIIRNAVLYGKKALLEAVNSFLFGPGSSKGLQNIFGNGGEKNNGWVNYTSYSKNDVAKPQVQTSQPQFDYRSMWFEDKDDAIGVLRDLLSQIEQYKKTTIGHLYSILGKQTSPGFFNYGWRDLSAANIIEERGGGYTLELPRAIPLD